MENPLPPGCRAKFRVERPIGAGGFGSVFLAMQIGLERPVAIKLLAADIGDDQEQLIRFQTEALVTASLVHPHIVVVLDHDMTDAVPWIAYEYLPGRSLKTILQAGRLPWHDALEIARQVADALGCAHARNVLHRDIKPPNILEASSGQFKVCDFGIARWTEGARIKTRTGVLVGTPEYMSPEQARGESLTPGSDLYSLGVLLFEMLTGRTPFGGDHPLEILFKHIENAPPRLRDLGSCVPDEVESLVLRCLAKSPGDRYPSAAALVAALEAGLSAAQVDLSRTRDCVTLPRMPPPEQGARHPFARGGSSAVEPGGVVRHGGPIGLARSRTRPARALVPAPAQVPEERRSRWMVVAAALLVLGGAIVALSLGATRLQGPPPPAPTTRPGASATPGPVSRNVVPTLLQDLDTLAQRSNERGRWAVDATDRTRLHQDHPPGRSWREICAHETDDDRRLRKAAADLAREFPDLDRAPIVVVLLSCRIRAFTFINWCRRQVYPGFDRIDGRKGPGGESSIFEQLDMAQEALSIPLPRSGVAGATEYFATLRRLLVRAAAEPETLGAGFRTLLEDLREFSQTVSVHDVWEGDGAAQVKREWRSLRDSLGALPGPVGAILARLVPDIWLMGQKGGGWRSFVNAGDTLELMIALTEQVPASATGLAPLVGELREGAAAGPRRSR
ncbi:MAG: serine/threonine protein kinase [Candidatus Riflebacteria bacterium]|nr:serine/threonine protein kinase [Candidatus Riflebacteria bacterium]